MVQDAIQLYDQNNLGTSQDQEEAKKAKRNKEAEAAEDQDQEGRGRAGDGGESCTIIQIQGWKYNTVILRQDKNSFAIILWQ